MERRIGTSPAVSLNTLAVQSTEEKGGRRKVGEEKYGLDGGEGGGPWAMHRADSKLSFAKDIVSLTIL